MAKTVYLTQEGYEDLKKELDDLINIKRPANIKAIKEARALGDLSENAEYDAARNEQAELEARIQKIEQIMENVSIIENVDNMSSKNTVLLCRNFWPYLDAFKREKLAQKLEDKFDESSIVVIGDYDEEDCKVSKLLMEHKFLPTAVRNVFQKGGEIPNLYNKPIEKSYVVDSSGRIFNLGKSDVNKQADNSIIVAKNSLNFY